MYYKTNTHAQTLGASMRKLSVAMCLGFVCAASSTAAPPLPPALQPYVHDGHYDPGDYGWMRGAFPGASAADKATFDAVTAWVNACFAADRDQLRSELKAMGIENPAMQQLGFRDPLCMAVAFMPLGRAPSYAELQKDAAEAGPYIAGYSFAVRTLRRMTDGRGSLTDQLKNRVLADQLVRIRWGEGHWSDAPRLSPGGKALLDAQLGAAMAEVDDANTAWLKPIVAHGGWPILSQAGQEAFHDTWTLVQHADADPAFQLQVLRLMEPQVAKGELDKQNYALLFDRVTLKTTGKQRYGTQMTCTAGKRAPEPVEDMAGLESRRAAMGLPAMADYLRSMEQMMGACPPTP